MIHVLCCRHIVDCVYKNIVCLMPPIYYTIQANGIPTRSVDSIHSCHVHTCTQFVCSPINLHMLIDVRSFSLAHSSDTPGRQCASPASLYIYYTYLSIPLYFSFGMLSSPLSSFDRPASHLCAPWILFSWHVYYNVIVHVDLCSRNGMWFSIVCKLVLMLIDTPASRL